MITFLKLPWTTNVKASQNLRMVWLDIDLVPQVQLL
jgi:hypothetical protein